MDRLQTLRTWMASRGLMAVVIPTNDCHFDEYVPARSKIREYLSGFTGSAGTLVVTATEAALWTDSRYFLQAARQIEGKGIELMKIKMPGTPSIPEWIKSRCRSCGINLSEFTVGVDGDLFSYDDFNTYRESLAPIALETFSDPFDELWPGRPAPCEAPIVLHSEEYSGESIRSKYSRIVSSLGVEGRFALFMSACDEIMYLMNLRGGDIEYNAVTLSYALLTDKGLTLFCRKAGLTEEAARYLELQGVEVRAYEEIDAALEAIAADAVRIVSGNCCSINKYEILSLIHI